MATKSARKGHKLPVRNRPIVAPEQQCASVDAFIFKYCIPLPFWILASIGQTSPRDDSQ